MAGSNPVTAGLTVQDLSYDDHGNTIRLADQELTYDVQDRHTATILDSGDQVSYVRNASGVIVERTRASDKVAKSTIVVILSCLVSVFLTGCGVFLPLDPADFPVSIQGEGSSISAVVCRSVEADRVRIQTRPNTNGEWTTIFDAKGHAEFSSGDELIRESQAQGMSVTGSASLDGLEVAQFMVIIQGPRSSNWSFFISSGDLSDDLWLHPDDSTTSVPCPEE